MVVFHMVWIKAKADASEAALAKFLDESATRLGAIEGVLQVCAGTRPRPVINYRCLFFDINSSVIFIYFLSQERILLSVLVASGSVCS